MVGVRIRSYWDKKVSIRRPALSKTARPRYRSSAGFSRPARSPVQWLQLVAHGTAQLLFTVVDGTEQACRHARPHAGKDFATGSSGIFSTIWPMASQAWRLVHGCQTRDAWES